ncbi:hypothetical protein ACLOJK_002459 [Asimina triloba]
MKMVEEKWKNDQMYKVWIPAGSGDYGYEGGYTSVLVGWETSIEPKRSMLGKAIRALTSVAGSSDEVMPKWWIVGLKEDRDFE